MSRRRCFFDITIDGELDGRIVVEVYDDIVPKTSENFVQLCTGQAGIGKTTSKPLTYKGVLFHRVVKNFMLQGGDFSANNGTGGESIYGGTFEDENFYVKHDQPFILSMANRGPNTNGSQFFITTNATPHLDNVHVAFGRVISGQDVVTRIEQLKVNSKSRPVCDVVIAACGQLVKKNLDEAGDEHEEIAKKKKKKKRSKSVEVEERQPSQEKENNDEKYFSTVKADDLPQVPETNSFLMRQSSPKNVGSSREEVHRRRSRSPRNNRPKVKGRGRLMYRSRSRSITPPHWKQESKRLISMDKLKKIQEDQKRQAEKREALEAAREKELARQETFGYRDQPMFEQRIEERQDRRPEYGSSRNDRNEERRPDYARNDRNEEKSRKHRERSIDRNEEKRHEQKKKHSQDEHQSNRRHRERSNEKEPPTRQNNEKMQQYEKRRQRRLSDIEREKYRKGDLANVEPVSNTYQQSGYQATQATSAYPTNYSNSNYYPPATQPPAFATQQQPADYQNGNQSYHHAVLAAAAQAYAKTTTAAQYATPHGHYSTVSSKDDGKKKADLPDSYVIETETAIEPLDDEWHRDHKKARRVHEVIENERVIVPSRSDHSKTDKSRRSPDRNRGRDSPPSKHRRTDRDERGSRRSNERRTERRRRSSSNEKRREHRRRSSSSSDRDRRRRKSREHRRH